MQFEYRHILNMGGQSKSNGTLVINCSMQIEAAGTLVDFTNQHTGDCLKVSYGTFWTLAFIKRNNKATRF